MRPNAVVPWTLSMVVIGCALITGACTFTISNADIPKLKTGSPLRSIPPLTVGLNEFRDARGVDRHAVGYYANAKIRTEEPVADVVANAIADEFRRNGHRVVKGSDAVNADVAIVGKVVIFAMRTQPLVLSKEFRVTIEVDMSADRGSPAVPIFTKTCRGAYWSTGVFSPLGPAYDIFGRALLTMVEDCTTDPAFIDALRDLGASRVPMTAR